MDDDRERGHINGRPADRFNSGPDKARQLRRILDKHLEERVTLRDLGLAMDLSPFQILRVFQRHCGLTPHQYLVRIRVEKASQLLLDGEPIAEVAAQVGFTDQSHMTKHFKRLLGVTPSKFRVHGRAPDATLVVRPNASPLAALGGRQ